MCLPVYRGSAFLKAWHTGHLSHFPNFPSSHGSLQMLARCFRSQCQSFLLPEDGGGKKSFILSLLSSWWESEIPAHLDHTLSVAEQHSPRLTWLVWSGLHPAPSRASRCIGCLVVIGPSSSGRGISGKSSHSCVSGQAQTSSLFPPLT